MVCTFCVLFVLCSEALHTVWNTLKQFLCLHHLNPHISKPHSEQQQQQMARAVPLTLRLIVHRDVGRGLHQGRPAVDDVDSALVLQLLGAFLQRLDEVLVCVGPDHPSLQNNTESMRV